jgi:hypothetical protein
MPDRARRSCQVLGRAVAGLLLWSALGCAPARKPAPPAAPPDLEGRITLRVLHDEPDRGGGGPPEPAEPEEIVAPRPSPSNRPPAYPEAALKARAAAATTVVRIVIDSEGEVIHVADSPREESSRGAFADAFRAATHGAVSRWRFSPAIRKKTLRGGRVVQTPITVYLDMRFDFTLVEGRGNVRSGVSESR